MTDQPSTETSTTDDVLAAALALDPMLPIGFARRTVAVLSAAGYVTIQVPAVGHKAECDTDASAFRQVAQNLDRNLYAGGSNVRAAVSSLLRNVADALTDDPRTTSEIRRGVTATHAAVEW